MSSNQMTFNASSAANTNPRSTLSQLGVTGGGGGGGAASSALRGNVAALLAKGRGGELGKRPIFAPANGVQRLGSGGFDTAWPPSKRLNTGDSMRLIERARANVNEANTMHIARVLPYNVDIMMENEPRVHGTKAFVPNEHIFSNDAAGQFKEKRGTIRVRTLPQVNNALLNSHRASMQLVRNKMTATDPETGTPSYRKNLKSTDPEIATSVSEVCEKWISLRTYQTATRPQDDESESDYFFQRGGSRNGSVISRAVNGTYEFTQNIYRADEQLQSVGLLVGHVGSIDPELDPVAQRASPIQITPMAVKGSRRPYMFSSPRVFAQVPNYAQGFNNTLGARMLGIARIDGIDLDTDIARYIHVFSRPERVGAGTDNSAGLTEPFMEVRLVDSIYIHDGVVLPERIGIPSEDLCSRALLDMSGDALQSMTEYTIDLAAQAW